MVAGNWKMNKNFLEGLILANGIVSEMAAVRGEVEIVLATPFIHLHTIANIVKGHSRFHVAAQNCHQAASGAYTGEISVEMLQSVGAEYVILGHSERRQYFQESDALLAQKVNAVLAGKLLPIFCCGEPLDIRQASTQNDYVRQQLEKGLFHLSESDFQRVTIAYEPIWAIGTGQTATPEQAQEMHAAIRAWIAERYSPETAQSCTLLYGGSCNAKNAADLFAMPDVDGALVGGASLQAADFIQIIRARIASQLS